jgi:hypothetical protein
MFKDMKKQGNSPKRFTFVVGSCAHFRSFGVYNSMSQESVIEKLQWIARKKEMQRSEHRQRQKEEAKLLRRTEVEKELERVKR